MAEDSARGNGERRPGAARAWAVWWVLLAGLYALLADNAAVPELATGAAAATVGATGAVLVRAQREQVLRPRAAWLLAARGPLLAMFTDLGVLARVLLERGILRRPGTGALVEVPYDAGPADDRGTAHRVLTQALGTLAPNTIVLELDEDRGVLVAHQLRRTRDPARSAAPLPPR